MILTGGAGPGNLSFQWLGKTQKRAKRRSAKEKQEKTVKARKHEKALKHASTAAATDPD
jgi:hypothetical protein